MKRDKQVFRLILASMRDGALAPELARYSKEEQEFHARLLADERYITIENPYTTRTGDFRDFVRSITNAGYDYLERLEDDTKRTSLNKPDSTMNVSVFISHSSKDAELAAALVALIRTATTVSPETIRCTSVNGYRFPAGTSTGERLKQEVHAADVFVALLTPNGMESVWVLFELGARWGASRHLAPLVAGGLTANSLKGPLSDLSALVGSDSAQMHQFLEELVKQAGATLHSPAVYGSALQAFVELASKLEPRETSQVSSKTLPEFTPEVLKFAAEQEGFFLAEDLARELRISRTRAEHYGEALEALGLVTESYGPSGEKAYSMTPSGNAYVVEKNLDRP